MRDAWEYASFVVTALALPFAIFFFALEQRKERNNEEEEAYQLLSDAYNDFLKVVLANPDLHLRTNEALDKPTREQNERTMIIYEMLISLFERAYIVAWSERMSEVEARRWNSWDDQGLLTLFLQDALRVKKVMRETQNAAGLEPGKALQRGAWPFWPQPGGNVVKTTPLRVALLRQTPGLAVVARLDWRCFHRVRTCINRVSRPPRDWCQRENFFNALPLLLRGEDPGFQTYILRVAKEERATSPII